jgi:3'-5' exoribonuclease
MAWNVQNFVGLALHASYVDGMSAPKPPLSRLSELAPGQRGDFFALLIDRTRGVTREGKPYYHCRFRNANRTVSLMVWSDDRWFEECENSWQVGRFYKLRAVYEEHERYGPQVEIHIIRPVTDADREDGFDEAQFVESSRHDLGHLFTELRSLGAKHIENESLRELVLGLLDQHQAALMRLPATRDRAYPYRGGWLEHTLSATRIAVDLAERYAQTWPDLRPPLNRDLVTAGAVLHDIGRVLEMGDDLPLPAVTVAGRLAGPLLLGRDLVREAARARPDVNPELVQLLEHILITSLYPPETGGPRWPLIPEGLIVQYAGDLDLKMAMYVRCLERDSSPGPFTERDPALGRQLLKTRGV